MRDRALVDSPGWANARTEPANACHLTVAAFRRTFPDGTVEYLDETYAWAESQGVVDWTKFANVGAPGLPEAYKNRQQSRA